MPDLIIKSHFGETIEIDGFLGTKIIGIEVSNNKKSIYTTIGVGDVKQIIIHLTKELEKINEA